MSETYESKILDHLGLVTGMCDELELADQIDSHIAQDLRRQKRSSHSRMSIQEPPVELRRRSERGVSKLTGHVHDVNQSVRSGHVQNANRPSNRKAEAPGNAATVSLVDHEEGGARSFCEPYRLSLPPIQCLKGFDEF